MDPEILSGGGGGVGVQFLRPENSLDNFLFSPQLISMRFKYSEGVQLFQGGGGGGPNAYLVWRLDPVSAL